MSSRRQATGILLGLAAANFLNYAARNALFPAYDDLRVRFGLPDSTIGLLTTVYMLAHAAATLPFGWLGDRFDRRHVIAVGLSLASLAGILGALTTGFYGLAASRAVVGLGTAAVVPIANSILGETFEGPRKASRLALFNLALFFGGATGFFIGSALGFPSGLAAVGAPGLILIVWILRLPITGRTTAATRAVSPREFFVQARELLRIPTLRRVMLSSTAMASGAGGLQAWLVDYLVHEKGMSKAGANSLLVTSLVAGLVGLLLGARVADAMRKRTINGRTYTIAIGMGVAVPCLVLCMVLPAGIGLTGASITAIFFMSWYHAPMAATVDDLAPAAQTATAQGLVIATMHLVGTAPASWAVGALSQRVGIAAAMWLPIGVIVVATLAMLLASRTFAVDAGRVASGHVGQVGGVPEARTL